MTSALYFNNPNQMCLDIISMNGIVKVINYQTIWHEN